MKYCNLSCAAVIASITDSWIEAISSTIIAITTVSACGLSTASVWKSSLTDSAHGASGVTDDFL